MGSAVMNVQRAIWCLTLVAAFSVADDDGWLVLSGRVTDVRDGNNLRVTDAEGVVSLVTLAGLDAPELGQTGGKEARDRLVELVKDKNVRIIHRFVDNRGRTLGKVYVGDTFVNKILLSEGLAWRLDPDGDTPELEGLQEKAQEDKLGIWKNGTKVVPPWFWRRGTFSYREGMENRKPKAFPRSRSTNKPQGIGYP
jgi:endonuclease YncB( thermonuclease family)